MRPRVLIRTGVAAAAMLSVALTLGQPVRAQDTVPRPNIVLTRLPTLMYSVLPADVNHDGHIDLVGEHDDIDPAVPHDLRVRLGNGDGTFASDVVIASGDSRPLAVADFDGDGNLDVLTTSGVFPGHGDGTFGTPVAVSGLNGTAAVVADFDGNGTLDFAATAGSPEELAIYPGYGDLTFGPPATFPTDDWPDGITAADFNHDGTIDIAIPTRYGYTVDIYLNHGGLLFTTASVALGRAGLGITTADVDGDGSRDLLVSVATEDLGAAAFTDGYVYLLHGHGDGTFTQTASFPTNRGPMTVVTGDFNRDGVMDIATGNISDEYDSACDGYALLTDNVSFLPGLGGGVFGPPSSFALFPQSDQSSDRWPYWHRHHLLRAADVDGDGQLDLITSPGAVLLNVPAAVTHPPTATARVDIGDATSRVHLMGTANDADNDWLSFEWTNASGTVLGRLPNVCTPRPTDVTAETYTLTVRDDRYGVATSEIYANFTENATLPNSDWSSEDVGSVGASGATTFDNTTLTVSGSGADVWGTADEFHYAYELVPGNFDVSTRVASVQDVDQWTKAGIMIRESATDPSARHVSLFATPTTAKGIALQWRSTAGGSSSNLSGPATAPPEWLRLVRVDDIITAYARATDSDSWTAIGTVTLTGLQHLVAVGLAVTSHADGVIASARFDHFTLSVRPGSTLPDGWTGTEIGHVGAAGSSTYEGGQFTVKGSGADIWGTHDEFQYAFENAPGTSFDITAEVTGVQNVDQWTKAGVMVRDGVDASAAHASLFVTPTTVKGVAFQRRTSDGGTSVHTAGPSITAPVWVKLIVRENTVRAYYRIGTTTAWTFVGQDTIAWSTPNLRVGLAVTSHADGTLATATFTHVSVHQLYAWHDDDVGSVGFAGSTSDDSGTTLEPPLGTVFTVRGSGADIWDSADGFHYRYVMGVAVQDIAARVLDVDGANVWTKAGVMLRNDPSPGSMHVMVVVTPGKGVAMQYRASANGISAMVNDIPGAAPQWVRLVRSGSTVTGQMSNDGVAWEEVGSIDLALDPMALGGLVVTSHDNSTTASAVFDDVVVN